MFFISNIIDKEITLKNRAFFIYNWRNYQQNIFLNQKTMKS